jgi:hypothetical protein
MEGAHECWNAGLLASLHDLGVALVVGGDEDNLGVPCPVGILHQLHYVWASTTLLAIPPVSTVSIVCNAHTGGCLTSRVALGQCCRG